MKNTTKALSLSLVLALAPGAFAAPQQRGQNGQTGQHQERGHTPAPQRKEDAHTGQTRQGAERTGQREQPAVRRENTPERPHVQDPRRETPEVVRPKDQRQGGDVVRPKDLREQDGDVVRPKDLREQGGEVVRPKDLREQNGGVVRPKDARAPLPANYRGLLESYRAEEHKHMERNARIQRLQDLAAGAHDAARVEALQDLHRRERLRYIAYEEALKTRVGPEVWEKLQHDLEALKIGALHGPSAGHAGAERPAEPVRPHATPERGHTDAPVRGGERDATTPPRGEQPERTGTPERKSGTQRPQRGSQGGQ